MPAIMAANIILFMILLTLSHSVLRNRQKKGMSSQSTKLDSPECVDLFFHLIFQTKQFIIFRQGGGTKITLWPHPILELKG